MHEVIEIYANDTVGNETITALDPDKITYFQLRKCRANNDDNQHQVDVGYQFANRDIVFEFVYNNYDYALQTYNFLELLHERNREVLSNND